MKTAPRSCARNAQSLSIFLTCVYLGACAYVDTPAIPVTEDLLLGTWKVDLRPTPDAEPYYQDFVVTSVRGKSFSGSFYGAPITQGRINTDWGTLRIAFMTADGSGPYHHSATFEGNRLEGLSNSTGRDFLAYWTAVKQQ